MSGQRINRYPTGGRAEGRGLGLHHPLVAGRLGPQNWRRLEEEEEEEGKEEGEVGSTEGSREFPFTSFPGPWQHGCAFLWLR